MSEPALPEELIKVVQVIGESPELRQWFAGLEHLGEGMRAKRLEEMAAQLSACGEPEAVVLAVRCLAQPEVYRAAQLALQS